MKDGNVLTIRNGGKCPHLCAHQCLFIHGRLITPFWKCTAWVSGGPLQCLTPWSPASGSAQSGGKDSDCSLIFLAYGTFKRYSPSANRSSNAVFIAIWPWARYSNCASAFLFSEKGNAHWQCLWNPLKFLNHQCFCCSTISRIILESHSSACIRSYSNK